MMQVFLGDEVTVSREINNDITWVTGRVSGIVQTDEGNLKYFYIKGIDGALWMSDGWKFQEEIEEDEDA
jgi:hypothetical protein